MPAENVAQILSRVISGDLTHDQIDIIRIFLLEGLDISAFIM